MSVDFTKATLRNFIGLDDRNMYERASYFYEFYTYHRGLKHDYFRRVSTTGSGPVMKILDVYTGKEMEMIYMASNDYLNLTKHPKTIAAGIEALKKYGTGASSVPLLGGTFDIHTRLEEKIAKFKRCEDAILYSSGFGANIGTLLALLQKKDVAILDIYDHASLIDGCANTNVQYFRHNNLDSLQKILEKCKNEYRTKLIVVDGVFSMDGDITPLDKIVEMAEAYGAFVMVDEAHATGVIGKNGRGTPEHFNIEGKVDIVAGTFSKALGSVGGYVAAKKEIIELLHFYSRTYVFSTAPTPQSVASLIAALEIIETEPWLREKLWDNINYFKENLLALGFDIGNSKTAIFPIIIGDDIKVLEACRMLHENGIYVNPVQYPAVPRRLSRIRISLMSAHEREHLDKTLSVLDDVGKKLELIRN
jgi:glycine C-acetyltransferase